MKAMIPSREFELRKAQATATLAATKEAATRAVILEDILAGALVGVIPTQGEGVEDPTGGDEAPGRISKTTPKCSR
jgi:hypothetical protein